MIIPLCLLHTQRLSRQLLSVFPFVLPVQAIQPPQEFSNITHWKIISLAEFLYCHHESNYFKRVKNKVYRFKRTGIF